MKHRLYDERMNRRALQLYAEMGVTPRCAPLRDWGNLQKDRPGEMLLPHQYGGVEERRRVVATPQTTPQPIKHGTNSGYVVHVKRGEDACEACKQARRDYRNELNRAKHNQAA